MLGPACLAHCVPVVGEGGKERTVGVCCAAILGGRHGLLRTLAWWARVVWRLLIRREEEVSCDGRPSGEGVGQSVGRSIAAFDASMVC